MFRIDRPGGTLLLAAMLISVTACDEVSDLSAGYELEIISGADQTGSLATALAQPIRVRLHNADGASLPGELVRWRVLAGGGSVSEGSTRTDSDGVAAVTWSIGIEPGKQLLLGVSGTATVTVEATGIFRIVEVAAGYHHSCALYSSGEAYCWGENQRGQLGDNTANNSFTPVRVVSPNRFREIAAGWSHTCAVDWQGAGLCWGDNSVGQLGIGFSGSAFAIPMSVAVPDPLRSLSAGFVHTCAVTEGSQLICWGVNERSQLGGPQNPMRHQGLQVRAVAAGEFHSCAVLNDTTARCWGFNAAGETGNSAPPGTTVPAPAPVSGAARFTDIAVGVRHSCAIGIDRRAYCWGLNGRGETGLPPFVNAASPVNVDSNLFFTAIGIGNEHACGLSDGRAYCWGGLLGDGTTGASSTPRLVSSTLNFSAISVGYAHTCGVANDAVWCWGSNSHGQLGQANPAVALAPVRIDLPLR